MDKNWHPSWWNAQTGSSWDRVKEAMRRDWEQTKHDLHVKGGHELNQGVGDTVAQASGEQAIPPDDRANPPKVVGSWNDAEVPMGYGYGARQKFGAEHPQWNDRLEATLKTDWEAAKESTGTAWNDVKRWVRHGYEYKGRN
ncbi:MAG: hypothetical protein JWM74_2287 [Myxococcaceae bacterium]|nr:hypothetical protein [Myxococcaceae bacterium]